MNRLCKQIAGFGVVGAFATGIDYLLLVAFHECFAIDILPASVLSFSISTVFNYFASMKYVFRHKANYSRYKEFCAFVVLSVVGLGLNSLVMWGGEELCVACGIDFGEHMIYLAVKICATAVVLVWNFISRKVALDAK